MCQPAVRASLHRTLPQGTVNSPAHPALRLSSSFPVGRVGEEAWPCPNTLSRTAETELEDYVSKPLFSEEGEGNRRRNSKPSVTI